MTPTVRILTLVVAALAVAGGCTRADDGTDPLPTTVAPSASTLAGAPTIAPLTTAPPPTAASTTAVAPTTAAPTTVATVAPTTVAPTTAPATTAPATGPPTTVGESLAVQSLVLSDAGIGGAAFGGDPEEVIGYVTSIIGGNTADTGWVAADAFGDCRGSVARKVEWGTLRLLFTDESAFASGRNHFVGWEYGDIAELGNPPAGLRTAGGVALGSRITDLSAAYPDVSINEGDPNTNFPDNFYVNEHLWGFLGGTAADDFVTVMFGGEGCGDG